MFNYCLKAPTNNENNNAEKCDLITINNDYVNKDVDYTNEKYTKENIETIDKTENIENESNSHSNSNSIANIEPKDKIDKNKQNLECDKVNEKKPENIEESLTTNK